MNVLIFVYKGVQLLDIIGPSDSFEIAGLDVSYIHHNQNCNTVELNKSISINVTNLPEPNQDYIFVVPEGEYLTKVLEDEDAIKFIKYISKMATISASVCAGSLLLAKAGVLDNNLANCHWLSKPLLKEYLGLSDMCEERNLSDKLKFYASSGTSSGIDMLLQIIEDLYGIDKRMETELILEHKQNLSDFETVFKSVQYLSVRNKIKQSSSLFLDNRKQCLLK